MTREEAEALLGIDLSAFIEPPTDAEIRAHGEACARIAAEVPGVLVATYDHAERVVNVTVSGDAVTFPLVVNVGRA